MELAASTAGKVALRPILNKVVSSFRQRRFERLIAGLEEGKISLDSHELESDSFISCFLKTNEAIEKSSTDEKINFLIMEVVLLRHPSQFDFKF